MLRLDLRCTHLPVQGDSRVTSRSGALIRRGARRSRRRATEATNCTALHDNVSLLDSERDEFATPEHLPKADDANDHGNLILSPGRAGAVARGIEPKGSLGRLLHDQDRRLVGVVRAGRLGCRHGADGALAADEIPILCRAIAKSARTARSREGPVGDEHGM